MNTLEDSLTLANVGEGQWRAHADPGNEAGNGMYGGWTAALLLKSIVVDERAEGEPTTLTVNYVNRLPPGRDLILTARPLGGSRSVTTWQADVRADGHDEIGAIASVVMANRRDGVGFTEFAPSEAGDPSAVDSFHPPAPFGQQIDVRPIYGMPPLNRPDTRSISWEREMTGHPMDHVLLAFLSDCYVPRIVMKGSTFRPSSTLTMSVYFYATAQELAAVGDDYILAEATGTRAESSTCGSQLRLWSRAGALLATSEQMTWFK